ncbi:FGGY-family carbohydrate kinase [Octadecabacter ascidiaceicola]|uniref:L-fuculokinase n=1 Tax=Octadecabacter ascidiaceicola TaxID=1655543 RepID=A0A238K485_9RHOB|nr:FGGY-family carbohydrate kinase [Octadecabacter ascidiaceicola]SMX36756.1 L-fuculokinase [Octadecabacter ascidiaceicola]
MTHVAVIDIGKTNAKLALVDMDTLNELAVVKRPNTVLPSPPWPHFDVDGIWEFLLDAMAQFHQSHGINAISITTHGACAALVGHDGRLAAPILDYEHDGPNAVAADYDAIRPRFEETGAPRLPMGLNLGAQLYWQFREDRELRDRTAALVTYPQYWGYRMTGVTACDVSSLGCHTDLWNPHEGSFSDLVLDLNIADLIGKPRKCSDILGTLLPGVVVRTGLDPATPVYCGIHDSNASLLPHVLRQSAPFSVVSTGTWVIAMSVGGDQARLDPTRDTLINVNALGDPVPSARFMGGREYNTILKGDAVEYTEDDIMAVAQNGPMLLPSIIPESGPFQNRRAEWVGTEPPIGSIERTVATAFYLALMTAECLALTGHNGPVIVEGPFAGNPGFCTMLGTATNCTVEAAGGTTGTSEGAALLALPAGSRAPSMDQRRTYLPINDPLFRYATSWKSKVAAYRADGDLK